MSKNQLFEELTANLMEVIPEIKATAIVDKEGLIISSKLRDDNTEDNLLGTVTAVFDSFIKRIKIDFGSAENFVNIITIENHKFLFADAGNQAILTVLADLKANDTQLKVLGDHIARKIKQILLGEAVETRIPPIIKLLGNMKTGSLPTGEYTSKIIILGDPSVGKTSLIRRFVDDKFLESYISTIGVDISRKVIQFSPDLKINIAIWDIAGQMKHSQAAPFTKRFYHGANQCFIVFDLTRRNTFENIEKWMEDARTEIERKITFFIVANKSDLSNSEVSEEEVEAKANSIGCAYIMTSAKTGNNVDDAFKYAGYKFCENIY